MKKLRIALLGRTLIRIPPTPKYVPQGYSGAPEKMVGILTEELVKRGHDVTLFASGDSETSAKLVSVLSKSSSQDKNIGMKKYVDYEYALISKAYQMANEGHFDIIHSHYDALSAHFAPLTKTPSVMTIHCPVESIKGFVKYYKNSQYYISISDGQRKDMPDLNYISTIYHGMDYSDIKFNDKPEDYLAVIGRVSAEKGTHIAVEVARKLKKKLYIVGDHTLVNGKKYFDENVKRFVDGKKVILTGFLDKKEVCKIAAKATAVLHPVQVGEAFGLSMVESMACGTPIIAFNRGSIPEIVEDGKTGFVVKTAEQMVKAFTKIETIDRAYCRKYVENKFPLKAMIDKHEEAYYKILAKTRR